MEAKTIFKVIFVNQGKVYEVYARSVTHSDLLGFISIEQFIFGEGSGVLIDPAEEKLKTEFSAVKRSYVPMHSIIRIDEVEKEGPVKIVKLEGGEGHVVNFPGAFYSTTQNDPHNTPKDK